MRRGSVSMVIGLLSSLLTFPSTAQEIVSASPDVTINLGANVTTADEDVAVDNQLGVVVLESLGPIPDASDVIALGMAANGDRLLAFDTTTALDGGIVARAGDVVRYNGSGYSIEFDATVAGVPMGVATDATSVTSGGLLLSFDATVDLGGGLAVSDEDLVRWNGSSFSMAFDGSAAGLDTALDIDAGQDLGGGVYLMSFDTTGTIGGIVFADEDVVRFDGASWTLAFDGSAADADWAAADLDAVMVPEPVTGTLLLFGSMGLAALASMRGARSHIPSAWTPPSSVRRNATSAACSADSPETHAIRHRGRRRGSAVLGGPGLARAETTVRPTTTAIGYRPFRWRPRWDSNPRRTSATKPRTPPRHCRQSERRLPVC